MTREHLQLALKWWRTWHRVPVFDWIRGAAHYRAGRYEQAMSLYERGLAKHPHHPASMCARLDLSFCLFRSGKMAQAEAQLKQVTLRAPHLKEGHIRLARLQLWTGRALEAAWTMHRAVERIAPDPEMIATFLLAALEVDGPSHLLEEAIALSAGCGAEGDQFPRLELARARLLLKNGNYEDGRERILNLATDNPALFEAILAFGELLIEEGKIAHARRHLRRAMIVAPEHPRLLSLLAESYLKSGPFYNGQYAAQLALQACQASAWMGPREMHILAESYYHTGDKMSALLIASKAKEAGNKLLGSYRDRRSLERLIESLSAGTLA